MKIITLISAICLIFGLASTSIAQDKGGPKKAEKKAYPIHWGKIPDIQTRDYTELPGGYGMGSGTLARWITENMEADKKNPERLKEVIAATNAEILVPFCSVPLYVPLYVNARLSHLKTKATASLMAHFSVPKIQMMTLI